MDRVLTQSARTSRSGLWFGLLAYSLWGAFPGYFPLLVPASALEILLSRIVWSLVTVGIVVVLLGRISRVIGVLRNPRQRTWLSVGAVFIAVNWGLYIWGVNAHRVVETSLGYFVNPLVTVLLGVFILHERLRRMQWVAVAIASAAIVVLTVGYGELPWIALILAGSFGMYGLAKKQARVDAVESLAVETLVLTPFALVGLAALGLLGQLTFSSYGVSHALLLMSSGLVTTVPLLFFGAATKRLPLSTVGLLQYLTPVLQFVYGIFVDHEPLSTVRLAGFVLVWVALIVLIADGVRSSRRRPSTLPIEVAALG